MASALKRTPFYSAHVAAGARLIDFGGWEMPVQYAGLQQEHRDVRAGVVCSMSPTWAKSLCGARAPKRPSIT